MTEGKLQESLLQKLSPTDELAYFGTRFLFWFWPSEGSFDFCALLGGHRGNLVHKSLGKDHGKTAKSRAQVTASSAPKFCGDILNLISGICIHLPDIFHVALLHQLLQVIIALFLVALTQIFDEDLSSSDQFLVPSLLIRLYFIPLWLMMPCRFRLIDSNAFKRL